jgi:hypothetical protein
MFTVGGDSGDVHSYFSYFERPHDAFVTLFSIIHDLDLRVRAKIKEARYPLALRNGKKIRSLSGLCDYLKSMPRKEAEEELEAYVARRDFERWIRESVGEEEIAKELQALSLRMGQWKYPVDELRELIYKIICK